MHKGVTEKRSHFCKYKMLSLSCFTPELFHTQRIWTREEKDTCPAALATVPREKFEVRYFLITSPGHCCPWMAAHLSEYVIAKYYFKATLFGVLSTINIQVCHRKVSYAFFYMLNMLFPGCLMFWLLFIVHLI